MSSPHRPSLEVLRKALGESVLQYGTRHTAREVGISKSALPRFVKDGVVPYPKTLNLYHTWYRDYHLTRSRTLTAADARAALTPLVLHLPLRSRETALRRMIYSLAKDTERSSVEPPRWLREMRGEAEEKGE